MTAPLQQGFDFNAVQHQQAVLSLEDYCPKHLRPNVVVSRNEPSLSLCDLAVSDYIRARMTPDEMRAEIDAISDLAQRRESEGDYGILGIVPSQGGYGCIDSGRSLLTWMHGHELKRMHQLKLSLPSYGEESEAAKLRIKARIAARREARLAKSA